MSRLSIALSLLLILAGTPLLAQTTDRDEEQSVPTWDDQRVQFWIRGQGMLFGNFFQATEGSAEEDVSALLGEIGASVLLGNSPVRLYGLGNYLSYDDESLDASPAFRVGLRSEGKPHSFHIYGEQLIDRPSFDVGDEFDTGDITNFVAEYAFRFSDWQLGVEGEVQQQEYEISSDRDNDFSAVGANIRYRGSRVFSPEIGFKTGERDVDDPLLSYDQDEMYLQIRSAATSKLYLSFRVRQRDRGYTTTDVDASNFGREDDRRQLSGSADYSFTDNWILNLYGSHESVDVNLPDRDFDTSLLAAGLTFRF